MKTETREEHLAKLRAWYTRRGKRGKSVLLNEVCEQYGYSRKHAIKLLGDGLGRRGKRRPGKAPVYGEVREVVERVWKAAEQACGKRLVVALPLWLPHYEKHFEPLSRGQRRLLGKVSASTLDRLLSEVRALGKRGMSGTKPGTLLRRQIPIQGEVWDERRAGFMEADSVAHCGSSMKGDFIWSLVYTDMATGWTEGRAVWNKGWMGVLDQTRNVEESLPFRLLGFDFDNGGEWLNWHLVRYLQQRRRPIQLTRSRPYHKDDNAHVEQKNWMWPRQLLGYGRLDIPGLVEPINEVYKQTWGPLQNCFLPSMKLKEKWREGSRWVRRHEKPRTALRRVLSSPDVSAKEKKKLREWYALLDPFELAEDLERRLSAILKQAWKRECHLGADDTLLKSDRRRTGTNGI